MDRQITFCQFPNVQLGTGQVNLVFFGLILYVSFFVIRNDENSGDMGVGPF